jgi:hypothetical protein
MVSFVIAGLQWEMLLLENSALGSMHPNVKRVMVDVSDTFRLTSNPSVKVNLLLSFYESARDNPDVTNCLSLVGNIIKKSFISKHLCFWCYIYNMSVGY